MKGEYMNNRCATTGRGIITAALVFLFSLTTIVPAEAGQFNLKGQLRNNGVTMKIVSLDRTDGFKFGLSFADLKNNTTFVLAPGLDRRFLVQAGGSEVIMQRDTKGKMEIIQSDGDIRYVLCIVQSVVTFLSDLTLCQGDTTCVFTSVISLVTNILSCNSVANPTT